MRSFIGFAHLLTLKKRLFLEHYKAVKSGTKAAQMAGYSPKSAHSQATRLLKDADISKAIAEWEQEEAKRLVPDSKETYTRETFKRSKEVEHPPTAAKYWELGGKAAGYLSDEAKNDAPIFNIIANELKFELPGVNRTQEITQPSDILCDLKASSTSNRQDGTHSKHYRTLAPTHPGNTEGNGIQVHEAQQVTQHTEGKPEGVAPGASHTPQPGSLINVNPLPKSPQVLNSVSKSQNLVTPPSSNASNEAAEQAASDYEAQFRA